MGLEDTLNNVLRRLGETVESDRAEKVQAPFAYKDLVQHDPILQAQRIEVQRKACVAMAILPQPMPYQTLVGCCLEGAQGGTKHISTMEVNGIDYRQPDALISDHPPSVKAFLCGQGGVMNDRCLSFLAGHKSNKSMLIQCLQHLFLLK